MKQKIMLAAMLIPACLTLKAQTTQVVRWANQIGGSSTVTLTRAEDAAKGILEDGYSNTYVIGNYTGSISFQEYGTTTNGYHTGSPTTKNYSSVSGSQDVFLARYDIDGYCTWSASIGGAGLDEGNAITMTNPSSPSDLYITGMFNQSMVVAPSTTLYAVASGYAVNDAFILRYTTSTTTTPSLSWYTSFGGGAETCGMGIVCNSSNVFITGYYTEFCMDAGANFLLEKTHNDGTTGTTFSTSTPGYQEFPYHDMFIARFAASTGAYGSSLHTYGSEDEVEGHGIALSGTDVYVTGTYKSNVRFTTGSAISCSGHSDIFVARYPQSFSSTTAATSAATAGGPSTTYQAAVEEPFYKQDESYGICATNFGIFITGRFMDQATFGAAGTFDPTGSSTETYMFLTRYDAALTATPAVVTGSGGYSEGRGIFGLNGNIVLGTPSTIFVVGGAVSTASVNSTQVETNGYTAENVGFVARVAYSSTTGFSSNVNNFVDGIAQNENGLDGTGANDINCVGFAVSYRVGCGVRIGGRFSSKTAFGNIEKTCSGAHDAFIDVRENAVSVTANTFNCGSGSVTLTGTGGSSPLWTGPSLSSSTYTVTVSPSTTTTYTFSSTFSTCPASTTPVTVFNFPASSAADAGPNINICGATHSSMIGTPALAGMTYSWAPSSGIIGSTTVAQPTATTGGTTTFTVTATDHCGNISTDVMTLHYDAICPRRLMAPGTPESSDMSLSVFPNPNNGAFTVETNSTETKDVFVYDETGKLVYSTTTTESAVYIDITGEPKGLYLVKVVQNDQVQTARLVNQ